MQNRLQLIVSAFATLFFFASSQPVSAYYDPPSRVARLSYTTGSVSIQPSGEDDWTWAKINRPVTTGDSLWTSRRSRAELRIGSAALRADQRTSISLTNLDDRATQVELNTGTIIVRVSSLPRGETIEINTPNVAITLLRAGEYRIDAVPDEDYTLLSVRTGKAEVTGGRTAFLVTAGSQAEMYNTGSRHRLGYDIYDLPDEDSFDLWSHERDRKSDRSASLRYVSPELTGYEDLDDAGTWRTDSRYGAVWTPTRVSRNWAPYRQGKWSWVEPWGWTWVDDNRWGYVTSHYGRWVSLRNIGWAWVPPQRGASPSRNASYRPVYSPANVAFLGESQSAEGRGKIAWFPLAPGEAYVPPYETSREYVSRLNSSNTQLRSNEDFDYSRRGDDYYANQSVAGAIVGVASALFASSQSVEQASAQVSTGSMMRSRTVASARVAPSRASVLGSEAKASTTASAKVEAPPAPPQSVETTVVVAKTAPPPRRASFERRKRALEANPGKPLDASTEQSLRVQAPVTTPAVELVPEVPVTQVKPAEEDQPKRQKRDKSKSRRDRQMESTARPAAEPAVQQQAASPSAPDVAPVSPAEERKSRAEIRNEEREERKAEKVDERKQAEEKALKAREERDLEQSALIQKQQEQRAQEEKARQEQREKQKTESIEQKKLAEEKAVKAREERDLEQAKLMQQQQEQRALADKVREERKAQKQAEQQEQKLADEKAREERDLQRKETRGKPEKAPEEAITTRESGPAAEEPPATAETANPPPEERKMRGKRLRERPDGDDRMVQPVEPEASGSAGAEIDKPIAAAPQPDNTGTSAEPLRVEETIQAAKLVSQPKLKTPREARRASIEGVVKLEALIGADGRVKTSTVLSGPDELQAAAIENLGKRKYEPTFVDGKPVEVLTEVSLEFNGKD